MSILSINPATEEVLAQFDEYPPEHINEAIAEARSAFVVWRDASFSDRSGPMHRLAEYLRAQKSHLAGLITVEMGKPILEAEAEIEKCAWTCEVYATHAGRSLGNEPVVTDARESYIAFEPLGVVLAIMPWNFPFWQVFRCAVPTLMAGNALVLKHAPNVPQCALAIEEAFNASGFPQGLLRTLLISIDPVEEIITDDRIAAVTLTGSVAAGRAVAELAGYALKKIVLELGGSDPFIVLPDANMEGAIQFAVRSRYQNAGQSCIAAKRFIVVEEVAEEFEERFIAAVSRLRVGDPSQQDTQIGPLARADLRDTLDNQVQAAVAQGARVRHGGASVDHRGYFYAPTVLTEAREDMGIFQEEVFGPVAPIMRVRDVDQAITVANSISFGLGANLWTRNVDEAKRLARRIESGNVFINGMTMSDPRLPFGGVKSSGYGRELSTFGLREFVNIQSVWIGQIQ